MNKIKDAIKIINLILEIRGCEKMLSTYYNSTQEQIEEDGMIRSDFVQVLTATGRTSCKNINLQNQPPEVTGHFTSRYR